MKEGILDFVTRNPNVIESVDFVIDMKTINAIDEINNSVDC